MIKSGHVSLSLLSAKRQAQRQRRIEQLLKEREAINNEYKITLRMIDQNKNDLRANEIAFKEEIDRLKNLMEEEELVK
ncbi:hypothetical protein AM501_24110 [Aneurinibacillus migulanus]|uniref:hypothetical protein n=1 Tax=Aneurinibacillus migulanus TaxID=47500 RepID=UPI0005B79421|nr:hypothetical protein [Aneurinibacillus migulanus]KIV58908.1 hypothetical protein TS64_03870 [Aneurinibacillus migulanus]KPD05860.1 hypothetical protein AM501_24110 [Aneurinibacillus migulanus]